MAEWIAAIAALVIINGGVIAAYTSIKTDVRGLQVAMSSVDERLDKIEQGQIGLSLQLQAASRIATRRAGELEE